MPEFTSPMTKEKVKPGEILYDIGPYQVVLGTDDLGLCFYFPKNSEIIYLPENPDSVKKIGEALVGMVGKHQTFAEFYQAVNDLVDRYSAQETVNPNHPMAALFQALDRRAQGK